MEKNLDTFFQQEKKQCPKIQTLKINDFIRNYKEKRLYNRTLLVRVCKVFQMAPRVGFEPTTLRLTAGCSAAELSRNLMWQQPILPGGCPPSTLGAAELNFCVRNENRWILSAIVTTMAI